MTEAERVITHAADLTDVELMCLDGRCRPEVQRLVDSARERLAAVEAFSDLRPALAGLVADVVAEARQNGRLVYQFTSMRHCRPCGRSAGYARYKSGMRKGQPNFARPLTFRGVEMGTAFIRVRDSVTLGGCRSCVEEALPALKQALSAVPAEVPDELRAEGAVRYLKRDVRRCLSCGWVGHDGQMGLLTSVMGGLYPGACPACSAQERALGPRMFERLDEFVLLDVDAEQVVRTLAGT